MKYKKCNICHLSWNVSIKNKDKEYVCPVCKEEIKKKQNHDGIVTNVLLKNKNKFEGGIKL